MVVGTGLLALGAGAAIGGIASGVGAAAGGAAQADAASASAKLQMKMYKRTREDLSPFRKIGEETFNKLQKQLPELTTPFAPTIEEMMKTPGYQFTLDQGLKGVQNSYAAKGLGSSGAAMKGAADYATGLADNTYNTRFTQDLTNRQNTYNMLSGVSTVGQNAAAQTGTIGSQLAGNAGQSLIAGGNAQAAMYNGIGSAISNTANTIGGLAAMPYMMSYLRPAA